MYSPIETFPSDVSPNSELSALANVWSERKSELEDSGEYKEFISKMQREWAIETGIIERLYAWDRGVTEVLIQQGLDATLIAHKGGLQREEAEQVNGMIRDQLAIVEGLFSFVKGDQPLTEHFIRQIQADFTQKQESTEAITENGEKIRVTLLKGQYKNLPNNPRRPDGHSHEYCPPELVSDEMYKLIAWYRENEDTLPVEVLSAWLHHRFTQIHPFQDGNGRVARALATLVFLKAGLFPLVIRDSDRAAYIEALEDADDGDLQPLVDLFAKRQRSSILAAIGLEQQVHQSKYAEEIISSALLVLKDKYAQQTQLIDKVYELADDLRTMAAVRLSELADLLNDQFTELTVNSHLEHKAISKSVAAEDSESGYNYMQIVKVAKEFEYFANLEKFRSWANLVIATEKHFQLLVSFHGYGHRNNGVLVASALSFQRVERDEGGTEAVNIHPAMTELFQFNYHESQDTAKARFEEWLEGVLAIGLADWKRVVAD